MRSSLKSVSVFCPIMIEVKADFSVFFALFPWDEDSEAFSKTFKNLGYADFKFLCQGLGEGEFENVLDSAQVSPVIYEAVVILYASIDTAVELYYLICVQEDPPRFGCGFSRFCTEASVA